MSTRTPSPNAFLPTAFVFATLGWGGLLVLISTVLPELWPRWLFFFLIVMGLTGTSLPATAFLNHRFPSSPPASASVVLRQALWVGVYGATMAWLQIGRVFNLALALILLVGFAAIEWLWRWRERSRWNP